MVFSSPVTLNFPDFDLIGIAAVIAAVGAIWLLIKALNRVLRKTNQFFEDWYGTEGDSVHPPTQGILARIDKIEIGLEKGEATRGRLETKLDEALHELKTNDGASLRDAIDKVSLQQEEEVKERKAWAEWYIRDQQHTRREWLHVFDVVRRMISMAPSEQLKLWDEMSEAYSDKILVKPDEEETLG